MNPKDNSNGIWMIYIGILDIRLDNIRNFHQLYKDWWFGIGKSQTLKRKKLPDLYSSLQDYISIYFLPNTFIYLNMFLPSLFIRKVESYKKSNIKTAAIRRRCCFVFSSWEIIFQLEICNNKNFFCKHYKIFKTHYEKKFISFFVLTSKVVLV